MICPVNRFLVIGTAAGASGLVSVLLATGDDVLRAHSMTTNRMSKPTPAICRPDRPAFLLCRLRGRLSNCVRTQCMTALQAELGTVWKFLPALRAKHGGASPE